jgi:hypothetical protein
MADFQNALGERPWMSRKGDTPALIDSDTETSCPSASFSRFNRISMRSFEAEQRVKSSSSGSGCLRGELVL